jgi:hypothetical protein
VVSFTPLSLYLRGKYPLKRRMVEPYSRSGGFEEKKICFCSLGIEGRFLGCATRSLVTVDGAAPNHCYIIKTMLFTLLFKISFWYQITSVKSADHLGSVGLHGILKCFGE